MNETTNKQNIIIYCQSAYVSHDRAITGAMADPTIAEKGKLPQESYISYKRVGHFCHNFQHSSHPYNFCKYFYRFSRHTRTYCKNPRVEISNIEVFIQSPKLDLGCLSSSYASVFSHFISPIYLPSGATDLIGTFIFILFNISK